MSKSIYTLLSEVQAELKAPKGQTNKFGGYRYRSAEDILEAVKPLLASRKMALIVEDEITSVLDRVYVRATVALSAGEEVVSTTAFAREEETKKGMDGSQITGAASSYARKYALNGLFAIDDTKDSDATNENGSAPKKAAPNTARKPADKPVSTGDASMMDKAVAYIKTQADKEKAYKLIMDKYGNQLSDKQKAGLAKFVG